MADFEQKLQLLAERGTHVGPEELIERVEQQLAGHTRVVVGGQRKGRFMTKTDDRVTTKPPPVRRGVAWALTVFLAVVAVGAVIYLIGRGGEEEVVDTTTTTTATTTTQAPPTTEPAAPGAADAALYLEAADAWYANDFETVSRLLEIPGGSSDSFWENAEDVRRRMEYDSLVGGRTEGITCTDQSLPGEVFLCSYTLLNSLTDAAGVDAGDFDEPVEVFARVRDGKLVSYHFGRYGDVTGSFGIYLATIGDLAGYENCIEPLLDAQCAQIQLDNLDGWVEWNDTETPEALARTYLAAFNRADCAAVSAMSVGNASMRNALPGICAYEGALSGQFEAMECRVQRPDAQVFEVTCDGSYSNALNSAVGAPPVSASVRVDAENLTGGIWNDVSLFVYPEDEALLTSVWTWAQETGLGEDLADACGAGSSLDKTPECAAYLLGNLDTWAAWYPGNG